jgi:hypothetical protein
VKGQRLADAASGVLDFVEGRWRLLVSEAAAITHSLKIWIGFTCCPISSISVL